MKYKTIFTKKEFLVVLGCAFFLLLNIGAIGGGGRRKAKRMVCLTNLKQLTLAWNIYADDNNQKIVNGEAYCVGDGTAPLPIGGIHKGELVRHRVKLTPRAASRSRLGVKISGCPEQPKASPRCWSEKIKTMLGWSGMKWISFRMISPRAFFVGPDGAPLALAANGASIINGYRYDD